MAPHAKTIARMVDAESLTRPGSRKRHPMDAIRFDALTKVLIAETSRRRTLAGLLGAALGVLGFGGNDDADAAKSGKCKNACSTCQFCKKGKCKKKDGKKRCRPGMCQLKANGTWCASGAACQDGTCLCSNGQESCGDVCCNQLLGFVCLNGTCRCPVGEEECGFADSCHPVCPPLTTRMPGLNCDCCRVNGTVLGMPCNTPAPCCSGNCVLLPGGATVCAGRANGEDCEFDAQCQSGTCNPGTGECAD